MLLWGVLFSLALALLISNANAAIVADAQSSIGVLGALSRDLTLFSVSLNGTVSLIDITSSDTYTLDLFFESSLSSPPTFSYGCFSFYIVDKSGDGSPQQAITSQSTTSLQPPEPFLSANIVAPEWICADGDHGHVLVSFPFSQTQITKLELRWAGVASLVHDASAPNREIGEACVTSTHLISRPNDGTNPPFVSKATSSAVIGGYSQDLHDTQYSIVPVPLWRNYSIEESLQMSRNLHTTENFSLSPSTAMLFVSIETSRPFYLDSLFFSNLFVTISPYESIRANLSSHTCYANQVPFIALLETYDDPTLPHTYLSIQHSADRPLIINKLSILICPSLQFVVSNRNLSINTFIGSINAVGRLLYGPVHPPQPQLPSPRISCLKRAISRSTTLSTDCDKAVSRWFPHYAPPSSASEPSPQVFLSSIAASFPTYQNNRTMQPLISSYLSPISWASSGAAAVIIFDPRGMVPETFSTPDLAITCNTFNFNFGAITATSSVIFLNNTRRSLKTVSHRVHTTYTLPLSKLAIDAATSDPGARYQIILKSLNATAVMQSTVDETKPISLNCKLSNTDPLLALPGTNVNVEAPILPVVALQISFPPVPSSQFTTSQPLSFLMVQPHMSFSQLTLSSYGNHSLTMASPTPEHTTSCHVTPLGIDGTRIGDPFEVTVSKKSLDLLSAPVSLEPSTDVPTWTRDANRVKLANFSNIAFNFIRYSTNGNIIPIVEPPNMGVNAYQFTCTQLYIMASSPVRFLNSTSPFQFSATTFIGAGQDDNGLDTNQKTEQITDAPLHPPYLQTVMYNNLFPAPPIPPTPPPPPDSAKTVKKILQFIVLSLIAAGLLTLTILATLLKRTSLFKSKRLKKGNAIDDNHYKSIQ